MSAWIDRILDNYVRLQSDLRDPAGKGGGLRFADLIGPWKASNRAGWRHGHHSTQISRRAAQWRPMTPPIVSITISQGQTLPPWKRGLLPHVLCQFLGFRLVKRYANKVSSEPLSYCNTGVCSEELRSNMLSL